MSPRRHITFALPATGWDHLPASYRRALRKPGGTSLTWYRRGNRVESAPVSPRSDLYRAVMATAAGPELVVIFSDDPRCRYCGCVQELACEGGCSWIAGDCCSACAQRTEPLPAVEVSGG